MGRFSHENAAVMPDERTVYLTDDGYETVLFKFIADTAGDLSAGTLYAAQVAQDDTKDSAITGFDVEWIEMAASSNSEIQNWVDQYDGITTEDFSGGQNSYITDEEINDWAEGRLNQDLNEDGTVGYALDDRVAFLESRKAAAALGASDEWNKMEGVAFNANAPENLYLAMSNIGYGMSDGQGDIDVTQNSCGIVYRMSLKGEWDVKRIEPVISGGPYTSSARNECDVNNLAGPDNLLVLNDGRVLIGEDTSKHESNMVWLWGEQSEPLERNESLTMNSVHLVNAPLNKESSWNYSYQAEVNNLQVGSSYTAILFIKEVGYDDWKGLWWWENIAVDGEQYEHTFSLQRGCYFINASLYESDDLRSDVKNATVLSDTNSEFAVGTGTCTDGVYSEEVQETNGTDETQDDTKETNDDTLPGFGILLSMIAMLGAALISTRKK
jgi:hypothetical protein